MKIDKIIGLESKKLNTEFKECSVCAAKLGSPILCEPCLHNRYVIGLLQYDLKTLQLEKQLHDHRKRSIHRHRTGSSS